MDLITADNRIRHEVNGRKLYKNELNALRKELKKVSPVGALKQKKRNQNLNRDLENLKTDLNHLSTEENKIKRTSKEIPDLMKPIKKATKLTVKDKKLEEKVKELKRNSEQLMKTVTEGLASPQNATIAKVEALVQKGTKLAENILNNVEKEIKKEFTADEKPMEVKPEAEKEKTDALNILINMDIEKVRYELEQFKQNTKTRITNLKSTDLIENKRKIALIGLALYVIINHFSFVASCIGSTLSIAFSLTSSVVSWGIWGASLLVSLISFAPIPSAAIAIGYGLYCREDDGDLWYCFPYRKILARIFHHLEKFIKE